MSLNAAAVSRICALLLVVFMVKVDGANVKLQWQDIQSMPSAMLCRFIPYFLRKGTNLKCSRVDKTKMTILYQGSKLAAKECQNKFKSRPWNCSAASEQSPAIVMHAIPETAFLYAINSAGLAYSLAWACSAGKTADCVCKKPQEEKDLTRPDKQTELKRKADRSLVLEDKRCTKHSLQYGIEESRKVLENLKESDIRWRMDNHNKEAGRMALIDGPINRNQLCSCHGVSGACTISKCTLKLPKFSDVSNHLMKKYKSAVRVGSDNWGNLIPHETTLKEPTVNDLIYLQPSPNFCEKNKKYGTLGTKGRVCDKCSKGPGGCDVLCCNRGYKKVIVKRKKQCNCIFKYCCKVTCKECEENIVKYVCN